MLLNIENNTQQIWSDALHFSFLAKNTEDKWDMSTYVRGTIINCWIVIENEFCDLLEDDKISYRFKQNVEEAVAKLGKESIEWKSGWGQKLAILHGKRKEGRTGGRAGWWAVGQIG